MQLFCPLKNLTEIGIHDGSSSQHSINSITHISSETFDNSNNNNNNNNNNSNNNNNDTKSNNNTPTLSRRKASNGYTNAPPVLSTNDHSSKFEDRPIKHHSFVSEVPDVKHMERALLGLLDDFHSGKLKAFGSGGTMDQMTIIREQQESLAKLHFELAAAEEDSLENGNDLNATKAQENMLQLVQRLEQLSISIEQLQTSHTGL
ncbi:uncharacterized protein DDB_G0287625-like [Teleopsis dalmanni]|uniref:uncharacterized protein DDB_G0287625-like n=1 Tax=Teleopsis dalmanni TaxID=139649 RepID=UPI0018CE0BD9|nr:uncharacterized protein DDB_G0287625-like [Teleopsis dalmanni]